MKNFDYKNYILNNFKYINGSLVRSDRKNSLGSKDKDGYIILKIKGKQFKYHRVVWLVVTGDFPNNEIDHINRIRDDNRFENLRDTCRFENTRNHGKINKDTNEKGIYIDKTKGLKKKYCFKFKCKTFRFYSIEDAKNERNKLWKI